LDIPSVSCGNVEYHTKGLEAHCRCPCNPCHRPDRNLLHSSTPCCGQCCWPYLACTCRQHVS
jgi:hypothetical protein